MSRFKRISFWITAVLVVIFFLMSSTDLIIKEEVENVKKVSVFVSAEEDSYLDNFKKGIQEGASDSRVDVNYVMVSTSEEDAMPRIERECGDDVQAIILFSENPQFVNWYMKDRKEKVPVITVNTFENASGSAADVSFDVQEAAEVLAEEIQKRHGEGAETVLLTNEESISGQVSQILLEIFEEKGLEAECTELSANNIRSYKRKSKEIVFVGCWITETEKAMEYLDGEALYGVGYSYEILRGIRSGEVEGVAAFGMYSAGIHAMHQAVSAMEAEPEDVKIPCRMITEENIDEQQEFLIPVY